MPRGIYPRTEEHGKHIGKALKGRKLSEEHLRKIREFNKLKKGKNYFKFKTELFNNFSPTNMWLLGLFASDGCMIKEKSRGYRINFTGKIEDMEKIRGHLKQGKVFIHKLLKNHANLYFRDVRIYKRLLKLGMTPRKSNTLNYPSIPYKLQIEKHFIRGFFEGDGWVSVGKKGTNVFHSGFCSGSKKFLLELKKRLEAYNINSGNVKFKESKYGRCYVLGLSIKGSYNLFMFLYYKTPNNLVCSFKRNKFVRLIKEHKESINYLNKSIYKPIELNFRGIEKLAV